MTDFTDHKGRTVASRISAVQRYGDPITDQQRDDARRLLNAILQTAAPFGVTLDDFDWTIDLPGGCVDVVTAKARRTIASTHTALGQGSGQLRRDKEAARGRQHLGQADR
ncbi:hypothetical protein [Kitasatospora sp. MBT66]|uniref:hypothetical protein n=1 Tax=Kitasatospora sp. MBT66 TaxID=1444769 RepID=UPI0005BD1F81|nr:hypothetical protein [Kitasatospora sp. MBT66]